MGELEEDGALDELFEVASSVLGRPELAEAHAANVIVVSNRIGRVRIARIGGDSPRASKDDLASADLSRRA